MSFIDTAVFHNWDLMLKMSLQDYVTPGLNSIILKRTPEETLRLYVWERGQSRLWKTDSPYDTSLAIHNHAFSFKSETLAGWQENLVFEEGDNQSFEDAWSWNRYKYTSALLSPDGQMHLEPDGKANLKLVSRKVCMFGDSYEMEPSQLHRIKVPNDREVVILFHEYERVNTDLRFYSPREMPETPSTMGLYRRFDGAGLKRVLKIAIDAIDRGET